MITNASCFQSGSLLTAHARARAGDVSRFDAAKRGRPPPSVIARSTPEILQNGKRHFGSTLGTKGDIEAILVGKFWADSRNETL